ncbi:MAG: WD40 repeat domain-containing protein, partial [Deltaproteobacteria bacterium]|nr:WD40 repeat domain-containing protein [Deltaproteobacteria bacterium]
MKKTYEAIIRILFLLIVAAFFAGYASAAQWVKTDPADVNLTGVWTTYTTTTEIFCTGISGVIIHHDGTAWESMDSGAVVDLNAIWGTSATDIFAVGDNATILHYNGIAWSSQLSAGNNLNAVWGTPESNVYAVGNSGTILHYDGTTWSSMTSGTGLNLNGVWGSSATDVFAVGENLTILHYDGSVWTAFTPTSSTYVDLNAVWGY